MTGEQLRARRDRLGLSRGRLAGLAKVSPSYIQLLEDGYRPDSSFSLVKLDEALTAAEARA